jgi:uncharacterized protein YbbC (DUF1343 family)
MSEVVTGIERLLLESSRWLKKGAAIGMLVHPASVDMQLRPTVERFQEACPGLLKTLFSPQHGFWGEKQDNMIESAHEFITPLGVPAFSLYGDCRAPTEEMLGGLDVLIVDLQDVGCRVYTYVATLRGCLEACNGSDVKVLVADRPNPIGGEVVEGNLLQPSLTSFVGPHTMPMRHGMTLGELALMMRGQLAMDVDLEVIPMLGWKRDALFQETMLPWVPPSPNVPTPETCLVYPGQVLLEGTNLSEGRGTTRPFEFFGAPFIDPFYLRHRMEQVELPGVRFRAIYFEPTFHKWQGQRCGGLHIHVTDARTFRSYVTSLWILHEVLKQWGDELVWREPPYEYDMHRLPLDLLIGNLSVRQRLQDGVSPDHLETSWMPDLKTWCDRRQAYLVYPQ